MFVCLLTNILFLYFSVLVRGGGEVCSKHHVRKIK
jgi:hypothetical protein